MRGRLGHRFGDMAWILLQGPFVTLEELGLLSPIAGREAHSD